MNVNEAATELQQRLEQFEWLVAVAIGEKNSQDAIYVYHKVETKNLELESLSCDGWKGYPVSVECAGRFFPLTNPE